MSRDVGSLGPVRHQVRLDGTSLPAGVYTLALKQATHTATVRGVIAR